MNNNQNGKTQTEAFRFRWLTICLLTRTTSFVFVFLFLWDQIPANMATLSSKPSLHYSVSDWATDNKQISDAAEHKRNISHEIRQAGRALRNETANKVII